MVALVRVKAFDAGELTPALRDAVAETRETLRARFYPGTIRRLGGNAANATNYVEEMIHTDKLADLQGSRERTYVVVDTGAAASAVGLATLTYKVQPRVQRLPLPPRVTDGIPVGWLHPDSPLGTVIVTGWTTRAYDTSLREVYTGLLQEAPGERAWTVEPVRAGEVFHSAIRTAGMAAIAPAMRYDVGEARRTIPPVSQAYILDQRL